MDGDDIPGNNFLNPLTINNFVKLNLRLSNDSYISQLGFC